MSSNNNPDSESNRLFDELVVAADNDPQGARVGASKKLARQTDRTIRTDEVEVLNPDDGGFVGVAPPPAVEGGDLTLEDGAVTVTEHA
jgi:hypothetical protein